MADNKDTNSDSSNSEMVLDNKMVQLEDHAQLPKELTQDEISKMVLKAFNDTFNKPLQTAEIARHVNMFEFN